MKISFTDLWTYLECPQAFLFRKMRAPKIESTGSRVGNVVHKRADVGDTDEAREYQERQFAGMTERQRARAEEQVEVLVATEETLDAADESTDKRSEQLFAFHDTNWWFPKWAAEALPGSLRDYGDPSGWTFLTQVDQKSELESGRTQLVERKKGGVIHDKYREQLFYSGTVLLLGRHAEGPIHLVVRLLRAARDIPFWYKPGKRWEQLARWRKVVAEIVGAMDREIVKMRLQRWLQRSGETPTAQQQQLLEQVNFPAKPVGDCEWPCRECPWRHICPAKAQGRKQAEAAAAGAANSNDLVPLTVLGQQSEDALVA
jgi:hypothetical protein